MKRMTGFVSFALLALIALDQLQASGIMKRGLPPCEPGYQWVEEVVYKDVPRFICKEVPNTKKKWVYCAEPDAFCLPKTSKQCCADGKCGACSACANTVCQGPYCRKVLVKREIDVPCPGTKCVVEKIMEKVPCITYRKVPCGTAPTNPPEPIPAPKTTSPTAMPLPTPTVVIPVTPAPAPTGTDVSVPMSN